MADTGTYTGPALVELLGHRQVAGHVREVTLAGAGMLRVDVPPIGDQPGKTHFYSPGSLYGLHPVDEDTMVALVGQIYHEPVSRYAITATSSTWDDDEGQDDGRLEMARERDPDGGNWDG